MGTLLLLKGIYLKAFDDCKPDYLVVFLKAYSVFCALMLMLVFYAFFYRLFTGFEF
ncbi:MAG: hypothetical protein KJP14_05580 [Eudoraea sp.]|nr:hypothetical protein [Eudoraea sp.]MBT8209981.1 hypothetical protein [Eudoraea sp.]MBT8222525.1 hypothetical protein [Eudoraea sp.]